MNTSGQHKINAPLLYRLIDEHPESAQEKNGGKFVDLEGLQRDILDNLENLLNTRTLGVQWPAHFKQLAHSLLSYGMKDFSHHHFSHKERQKILCGEIKQLIHHFEPRLKEVSVEMIHNDIEIERVLKIRIEAMIQLAPTPIPAVFESCLDIAHDHFEFER